MLPPAASCRVGHCVDDRALPLTRHPSPARRMRKRGQHQPDPGGQRAGQRQHGVRGSPREQRARLRGAPAAEPPPMRAAPRASRTPRDTAGCGVGERRNDPVNTRTGRRNGETRPKSPAVGRAVRAQPLGRVGHRPGDDRGTAAVERLGELDLGRGERYPRAAGPARRKNGEASASGVRRRADVVPESWQRRLPCVQQPPRSTSAPLDDLHPQAAAASVTCSGQPVRAAANRHGVCRAGPGAPLRSDCRRARPAVSSAQVRRHPGTTGAAGSAGAGPRGLPRPAVPR